MSSANVDGMLREGVNALKSGRRDEARALLLRAVELDQYNEEAWLWLSGVLDSLEDQRTALENVLSINPGNDRASQGLDYINKQLGPASESPRSSPSAFAPQQQSGQSGIATSVEWGAADDAPPSSSAVWNAPNNPVPSSEVLDDWVSNLNLPSTPGAAAKPGLGASPFGDVNLGDDDDLFASGPFKADAASPPTQAEDMLSPAERTAQRRARSEARRTTTAPRREDLEPQNEVEAIFGGIPAEVMPTRLPGTVERAPVPVTLLIGLLVIVNLAAAVYFMMGFFG